jgi:hypothetical protein
VGRDRRRSGEVFDYIQRATGPWIDAVRLSKELGF